MRFLLFFSALLLICCTFPTHAQNTPWGCLPAWISDDNHFTMSVALADLNNDGYLDLLAGNYRYPYFYTESTGSAGIQESEFGAHLVCYQGGPNGLQSSPVPLTRIPRCIDCVVTADCDGDGDIDVAMGTVVAKGDDGGVTVLINQGTGILTTSFIDIPSAPGEISPYGWSSPTSYDAHCVRWVDFDCDGRMDLSAVAVGGDLHIYRQTQNGFNENPIADLSAAAKVLHSPQPPIDSDYFQDPQCYSLEGTTLEFGDIDMDGDLDLFVNVSNIPIIFKNRSNEGVSYLNIYSPFEAGQNWVFDLDAMGYSKGSEDMNCASFGFLSGDRDKMALAIGSQQLLGRLHSSPILSGWRNDIYTLDEEGAYLTHVWESKENFDGLGDFSKTQMVMDIQWASISGETAMDLVTASYPACAGVDDNQHPIWNDRGWEFYYEDPQIISGIPPDHPDGKDWSNQRDIHDLSTSLAVGDIGYNLSSIHPLSEIYSTGILPDSMKSVFYLHAFPLYEIRAVSIGSSPYGPWDQVTGELWCADLVNGWVSLSRPLLAELDSQNYQAGVFVKIDYVPYPEYDLVIGNDGQNVAYYANQEGTSYIPQATHRVPTNNPANPFEYDQSHFIREDFPGSGTVRQMSPDGIGVNFNQYTSSFETGHEEIRQFLTNYPVFKRCLLGVNWQSIEVLQGHYYWDQIDKNLDCFQDKNCTAIIFGTGHPLWVQGKMQPSHPDPMQRPSDERLFAMYMRSLVNRYRPNGVIGQYGAYGWNNPEPDWGVTFYQYMNEMNCKYQGYGHVRLDVEDPAIQDAALKTYLEYQMIKDISFEAYGDEHVLNVISPNFGSPQRLPRPLTYLYHVPPMPYLNVLNDLDHPDIPNPEGDPESDRVFWRFIDYVSQQLYSGLIIYEYGRKFWDPFTPVTCTGDSADLRRIGVEHLHWCYYTEGLSEYLPDCDPMEWRPVMKHPEEEEYSIHPFFCMEWLFNGEGAEEAELHWVAAELAEIFAIDVFPLIDSVDYYLLEFSPSLRFECEEYYAVYEAVASLLHDPNPDPVTGQTHVHFAEYEVMIPDPQDPPVYRYTYHNTLTNHYIHFIKTVWDIRPFSSNMYVRANHQGWDFPELRLNYSFSPITPTVSCYVPPNRFFSKEVLSDSVSGAVLHFDPSEVGPHTYIIWENQTNSFNVEDAAARRSLNSRITTFPNPFNAETTIRIDLPGKVELEMNLYNVRGQLLKVLYKGLHEDYSQVCLNGSDFTSGVYFIQARSKEVDSKIQKECLLKILHIK